MNVLLIIGIEKTLARLIGLAKIIDHGKHPDFFARADNLIAEIESLIADYEAIKKV